MPNDVVITKPGTNRPGNLEGRILNGPPGPAQIHKVGSAKQYTTKTTGRVCNQAKFPMSESKSSPRKK